MGDFAGLIALSAFPLALLGLFVVGVLAVWIAVRTQATRRRQWIAAVIAIVIVVLIPTWDVILGRLYFTYLCTTDSGMKIHKRVALGAEHANVDFPDTAGMYERLALAKQYPYRLKSVPDLPGPARIRMNQDVITDANTKEVLGERTRYFYGGGWFENTFSVQGAGGGNCVPSGQSFKSFLEQIFQRS